MMTEATSDFDDDDFDAAFDRALRAPSEEAARSMLARGRYVTYLERDTPAGHVVREYPDGTRNLVRIDLPPSFRPA